MDGSLNALALCLREGLGVRHVVVEAISAQVVNSPSEEFAVSRSELSKVLLAESPRHTPVQQGFHHLMSLACVSIVCTRPPPYRAAPV